AEDASQAVLLHRGDDVAHALRLCVAGIVDARAAEPGDDGVGAGDGTLDVGGIEHVSGDDLEAGARRELGGIAHEGADRVPFGEGVFNEATTDAAGAAEHRDMHMRNLCAVTAPGEGCGKPLRWPRSSVCMLILTLALVALIGFFLTAIGLPGT